MTPEIKTALDEFTKVGHALRKRDEIGCPHDTRYKDLPLEIKPAAEEIMNLAKALPKLIGLKD
jgi:hypothetical protein